jgi:hypothetical protein
LFAKTEVPKPSGVNTGRACHQEVSEFQFAGGKYQFAPLGMLPNMGRQVQTEKGDVVTDIPPPVDAHDGFEGEERRAGQEEEADLANTVNRLQLNLSKGTEQGATAAAGLDGPNGEAIFEKGGGSGKTEVALAPNAMQIMQTVLGQVQDSRGSGPHSSDMIPPLRGLSHIGLSQNSGSDVSMSEADSILGKRMAAEKGAAEASEQKLDLSLALNYAPGGGKQKKVRKAACTAVAGEQKETSEDNVAARTRRKIATGHVAPGTLTRSNGGPRQEK